MKPVASDVPTTTILPPISIAAFTLSCRNKSPHNTPNTGIKNVTVTAFDAPNVAIKRKNIKYAKAVHNAANNKTAPQAFSVGIWSGILQYASGVNTIVALICEPTVFTKGGTFAK